MSGPCPPRLAVITLTTDFGYEDSYVGEMKGVILSINPGAQCIDITHAVRPQNIHEGAWILNRAAPLFPAGTIHLGVVDPGVGGTRKPVCIQSNGHFFIGPDNGLFSPCLKNKAWKAFQIENKKYLRPNISNTFHGRDIFAPVAARLSLGLDPALLGKHLKQLTPLPTPSPVRKKSTLQGEVIRVDHFGNALTNIGEKLLTSSDMKKAAVKVGDFSIGKIRNTYADQKAGKPLALMASSGFLEIAVREGSAAQILGLKPGSPVTVFLKNS